MSFRAALRPAIEQLIMKEKKEPKLEDFISNPQFIKWVQHPDPDLELFWQKWIENHPHQKEMVQEAIFYIKHIHFQQHNLSFTQFDRVLSQVLNQNYSSKHSTKEHNYWINISKVAAILALFITVFYSFQTWKPYSIEPANTTENARVILKSNPNGQKTKFTLPDGTIVHLNASSSISFPAKFDTETRLVEMIGEAFFEVASDTSRSFVVKTDALKITALGTAFNVRAFADDLRVDVALTHGKVRVDNLYGNPSELYPGEQIQFNRETRQMVIDEFDPEEAIGWTNNKIVFASDNFDAFIMKLERWYGINIEISGKPDNQWRIKGVFENMSLELLMESVKFSKNIDYKLDDDKLKIILNN